MSKNHLPKIISTKKELYELLRTESLYLYGAGQLAKSVLSDLPLSAENYFSGVLVTDTKNNPSRIDEKLAVYAASDESVSRDASVLIAVAKKHIAEITDYLSNLGYSSVYHLSTALENEFLEPNMLDRLIKERLWRVTPHPRLDYLVVNIVDHCNLNCAGCDHFSPIADKREVSLERLEKDLGRLGELLPNRVGFMWIMGGEPLLHSNLNAVMRLARKNFPKTGIAVMSNGILLAKQSKDFWECCRENDIIVQVTKYPIDVDYDECKKLAEANGARFEYYSGGDEVKTLYHIPLDVEGKQDATENFIDCSHVQRCCMLSEGRLYPCTVAPNIPIFNRKFKTNIPLTKLDGIDIFEVENGDKLLEKLSRPMPVCRFCNIGGRSVGHKWRISKREIEEWI